MTLEVNNNGVKRLRIRVFGVVQGVGFRPFVKNLASKYEILGSVCNMGPYVEIVVQSGEQSLAAFLHLLKNDAPARAQIIKIETSEESTLKLVGFEILDSENDGGEVFVSPDIAICEDCKRELFSALDRRYLHPFINCTACGPRMTIQKAMPYDRERTSMANFLMCEPCRNEYVDSKNRRFHAQPVCCNQCGPKLYILGDNRRADVLPAVRSVIRAGGIAAIKGIGGFHLCCDAKNEAAVLRLRSLKNRPAKPFAVMAADIDTAKRECKIDEMAFALLDSPQKPILLLKRGSDGEICTAVAPDNPYIGLMLPYAPVQLLLFKYPDGESFTDCLVMTSGNRSGAPICINDKEAIEQLSGICDIILSNDREIRIRADDSVMVVYNTMPLMHRRSRGYAPLPFSAVNAAAKPIFAVGGETKNSFCIASGDKYYLSPYVGDLTDISCIKALDEGRIRLSNILRINPQAAVCDLHPLYNSSVYARTLGLPLLEVQHHFAHIAACMVENKLQGEVIGVAFDGTGYGSDGTIWGGEFLRVSYGGFERLGCLEPYLLAGGDKAATEGWRPAVSLILAAYNNDIVKTKKVALDLRLCDEKSFDAQIFMLDRKINCVTTTSAGRIFDAVSNILGLRQSSTFEGEAAMSLEFAAGISSAYKYEPVIQGTNPFVLIMRSVIQYIIEQRLYGEDVSALSTAFHQSIAGMVATGCKKSREITGLNRVALSGGVFANLCLLALCKEALVTAGFEVFIHSLVPPNDGGISLGQAAIAAEYFK